MIMDEGNANAYAHADIHVIHVDTVSLATSAESTIVYRTGAKGG